MSTMARSRKRLLVLTVVVVGGLTVIGANVHLVFVALTSQPDCIPHAKSRGHDGVFRAAKSAC